MSNGKRWGIRAIASLLIFIFAAIVTPIALIGHWGHRTVIDSARYLETVGPLVNDPAVQDAISTAVTNAVVKQVDTTSLVGDFLGGFIDNPTITDKLASPISAGVNNLIGQLVHTFVASEAFSSIWLKTNEIAQRSLVALLEGKPEGPVQVKDNSIVLDISSMLVAVQDTLVANGFDLAAKVTIPAGDAQVVLASSSAIGQLQFIYSLTSPILQWFPLLIALLFGLSVALARNRSRTVLAVGVALVALAGITRVIMNVAQADFVNQLQGTIFAQAAMAFWDTFFNYLLLGLTAIITLGVVIAISGWFAGHSRPATRSRTSIGRGLHSLGAGLPVALRRSIRSYAPVIRWAIAIVLLVILAAGDVMDMGRVIWLSLLAAGLFTLVEVLSGPDREDAETEVLIVETAS